MLPHRRETEGTSTHTCSHTRTRTHLLALQLMQPLLSLHIAESARLGQIGGKMQHIHTHAHKSKLKDNTNEFIPADLLSCLAFFPRRTFPHIIFSQSHAEAERREYRKKNNNTPLQPLHLYSTFFSLTPLLSLSLPCSFPLCVCAGQQEEKRSNFTTRKGKYPLIHLTAVIAYSQRPTFPLYQTERKTGGGGLGVERK